VSFGIRTMDYPGGRSAPVISIWWRTGWRIVLGALLVFETGGDSWCAARGSGMCSLQLAVELPRATGVSRRFLRDVHLRGGNRIAIDGRTAYPDFDRTHRNLVPSEQPDVAYARHDERGNPCVRPDICRTS